MNIRTTVHAFCLLVLIHTIGMAQPTDTDPYLWLEQITSDSALDWVRSHNDRSLEVLENVPGYQATFDRMLSVFNSEERIPMPGQRGEWIYNFWRDADHVRGVIRRTTKESYLSADPEWKVVLDIDQLAKREGENWVYAGHNALWPDETRTMLKLSRGGSDAHVTREYDFDRQEFIENGFEVPEAKSGVTWIDEDHMYVETDFGPGSLTASGYPRIVKLWERGTPLEKATTLYEVNKEDVGLGAWISHTGSYTYHLVERLKTFYQREYHLVRGPNLTKIDVPEQCWIMFFHDQMLVNLKTDWDVGGRTFTSGSILSCNFDDFMDGKREFSELFVPDGRSSVQEIETTKSYVLLKVLRDVRGELYRCSLTDGEWNNEQIDVGDFGAIYIVSSHDRSDDFYLTYTDFLTPTTLLHCDEEGNVTEIMQQPEFFDADGLVIEQKEAVSQDGTRVPYFMIRSEDLPMDGTSPTILYGYGGFQNSLTPYYDASKGIGWLEYGGTYVIANIRGGGEFGPEWHQAALKENRQNAYDDFYAVARDLIESGVTSPEHLGVSGGSNGGLLVGVAFTQRPELFNAVACAMPLLDMKRYDKLLAGASWVAEYGDPDIPEEWAYISKYSPYHNVDETVDYPDVFFLTSTRDDRVHPGHARKMAAKMDEMGHDFFYYENIEGGHGGSTNNEQFARMRALKFAYFRMMLDNGTMRGE